MGFFSRLRDDARFTAGAWRALRHTMPIARHPTRIFPTLMEEAAARHGDKPALISDAETLTRKLGVLAGHCDTIGRDVSEIEVSAGVHDVEAAKPLFDAGARLLTVGVGGPDYDLSGLEKLVAWRDTL